MIITEQKMVEWYQSDMEEDFRFSFAVGDKPDLSLFPAEAHVAVLGYDEAPLLPLEWDLTYVNFDSAGTYSATGYFTQQGLEEHKRSNPYNYTMPMIIQIHEKIHRKTLEDFSCRQVRVVTP